LIAVSELNSPLPPSPECWDWKRLRADSLRVARRALPGADAEEAVQEALLRAWRLRYACRAPGTPLPWVLEITRNETLRLLDRRARRFAREVFDPTSLDWEGEDREIAGMATRMTVEQALRGLAEHERRVLRLRYSEDLTQAEVARRLGMPEGTVKVRLHRARRRLRALLDEQALGPGTPERQA
jgi:RNA polymerase sigma-70 factor, ECF subfamily